MNAWLADEPKEEKEAKDKEISSKIKEFFLEKRSIFLWGEINDNSAREVVSQMLYLDAQEKKEISLYINSPGGVITSGMLIYDAMQMMQSEVKSICLGLAASMASVILATATGGRYIWPSAKVMIHQPLIGGEVQGVASDLAIRADEINKMKESLAKILADRCQKSFEQVMHDIDRDYWMNAQEALSYGIVDSIVSKL